MTICIEQIRNMAAAEKIEEAIRLIGPIKLPDGALAGELVTALEALHRALAIASMPLEGETIA